MIKAVIFDLFGTLTDTFSNHEQRIIDEFNLDVGCDYVEKVTNSIKYKDMDSYLSEIIKKLNLKNNKETREKLVEIFKQECNKEKLDKKAQEIIKKLKSKNLKLGIISNIPNPDWDLLGKQGLKKYFDVILYSYELGIIKPDFTIFELMLSKLNLKGDEAIMVGNSLESDIKGAENAGIKGILLDRYNKYPKHKNRITSLNELFGFI